jgi:hypothetical protein
MMPANRRLGLLALLVLLGLCAVAAVASAQTDPPSSGDWVVNDNTVVSSKTITITGNIIVSGGGGHLQLTDVNIRFSGSGGHTFIVTSSGRLTMTNGSITATVGSCSLQIGSGGGSFSKVDGVTITNSMGVTITTWRCLFTNNTIMDPTGNGITATPTDVYTRPLDISDNSIVRPGGVGIAVTVGPMGTSEVQLACVGNNVTNATRSGITLSSTVDRGHFYFERNIVLGAGGDGFNANLPVRVPEFRFDGVYVKNVTGDGVHVVISASIPLTKYVNDVHSEGNVGLGVFISYQQTNWDRPIFRRWNISENKGNGVQFENFDCATWYNGYNVNNESQTDYICVQTDLQIYSSIHRKGMAHEDAATKYVTSFRYIHYEVTWQNGEPCKSNTVDFEDPAGDSVARRTTDMYGWLPNITGVWDWSEGPTTHANRDTLTPYMTGGTQRLAGPTITFDRDLEGRLNFTDIQTPDLKLELPAANQVQNYANVTVKGSCRDPHSGVHVVQVSFDPETNWNRKSWYEADGLNDWTFSMLMFDGIYNVYVRAYDNANWPGGTFSNVTIQNITIDTTAPNMTVRPLPEYPYIITNSTQFTLLGFTDPDVTTVSINGEFIPVHGGSFNKQIILIEGDNTIVVVATDYAGNIAKAIRKVRYDSIAPILIVQYPPVEPPYLRTNRQTLVMGGFTDIVDVDLTIDGVHVNITAGAWSFTMQLVPGPNSIVFDAVDPAKNHNLVTVPVYYDNVPPEINVLQPKEGALLNTSTISISGQTATDILHNQIQINGVYIAVSLGVFNHELNVIKDGPLNITIIVEDIAGNVVTKVVHVELDTTAPRLANLSLVDGAIVNTQTLLITGMTEGDATLYVQNSIVTIVDGHFSTQVALNEGRNTVTIRATDRAGNARRLELVVFLDTIAPRYELDKVIGNVTRTKDKFITLTGNTEPGTRLTLTYNGQTDVAYVNPSGSFEHTIILGTNRSTLIVFKGQDVAGNVYTNELTVDRIVPEKKSFVERYPWVVYGIIILVVVIIALIFVTRWALDQSYERKLKLMGIVSERASRARAQRPGPARPQGRPLPRPPEEAATPSSPPQQPGRRPPPRPPGSGE